MSGRTVALVAVMADKDLDGLIEPLKEAVDYWFPALLPDNPRAAGAEQILQGLASAGVAETQISDRCAPVAEQLQVAMGSLNKKNKLLIFNSFFTITKILSKIKQLNKAQ